MFKIRKGIPIDFAHSVAGHPGACINIHGHTWLFEVELSARVLNDTGFVIDFGELKRAVLAPAHRLLDHSYACGDGVARLGQSAFETLGRVLLNTRTTREGLTNRGYDMLEEGEELNGAINREVGGIKLAVFPFSPTSELLAKWLFDFAVSRLQDSRVIVSAAHIYETLHPVEAVASFTI